MVTLGGEVGETRLMARRISSCCSTPVPAMQTIAVPPVRLLSTAPLFLISGETIMVAVEVGVSVSVAVSLAVAVEVEVTVIVADAVAVGVGVAVSDELAVIVGVAVAENVAVPVGISPLALPIRDWL